MSVVNFDAMLATKFETNQDKTEDEIQFFMWQNAERQEGERKKEKDGERLRGIEIEKTLGRTKGSREA